MKTKCLQINRIDQKASFILAFSFGYAILLIASFVFKTAWAEYDCSAKDDGWYYDPEFCHIYWRCTHGTAEEFECASGTAWDHQAGRCNWIDSVDCSRAEKTTEKIPSEDEEEENTSEVEDDDDTSVVVVSKSTKKNTTNKRMFDKNGEETDREDNNQCMNACLAC